MQIKHEKDTGISQVHRYFIDFDGTITLMKGRQLFHEAKDECSDYNKLSEFVLGRLGSDPVESLFREGVATLFLKYFKYLGWRESAEFSSSESQVIIYIITNNHNRYVDRILTRLIKDCKYPSDDKRVMFKGLKKFLLSDVHSTGRHLLADGTVRSYLSKSQLIRQYIPNDFSLNNTFYDDSSFERSNVIGDPYLSDGRLEIATENDFLDNISKITNLIDKSTYSCDPHEPTYSCDLHESLLSPSNIFNASNSDKNNNNQGGDNCCCVIS